MKNFKNYLSFGLLAGVLLFSSCEKDESPVNEVRNIEEESIAQFASQDENFSILVEALAKADLVTTLDGSGSFTVFAPTNEAFNKLFQDLGVSGISDLSSEDLKPILLYHVLGEEYTSSMIEDGYYSSLSPAQGRTVSMYIGTGSSVMINKEATVTAANFKLNNGVVHVIDEVLLPPTIVDIAATNSDFKTLVSAVVGANLASTLSAPEGTFTVFAPTDAAFAKLGGNLPSDLTPILLYHVLGDPVYSDQLSSMIVNTLNDSDPELIVEVTEMGVKLNGMSSVVVADIVGTNGVIHVIDEVILPINNNSVLDIAMQSAPEFTSLVAALAKANLASTFIMDGDYTVFAPTNDAFASFLGSIGVNFEDLTAEALTPILLYHAIGTEAKSMDLSTGYFQSLYTAIEDEPVTILVEVDGGVSINGSISVTTPDVDASNGVIHVIDGVMTPPTVVDIALNNSNFSELVEAVVKAGLVETLNSEGPFTIFAPTNQAFEQLYTDLGINGIEDLDAETLIPILQYHVVSGNVSAGELSNGNVTTLNGDISITLAPPVINNDAEIVVTDVQGTNGVVHAINKLLLPASK